MRFVLLFICLPVICFAQNVPKDFKPYTINGNDTIPFSKLDENFANYNYYFSSENHSLRVCYDIKLDILRSLVDHYNVRNIILEMPYSYSYLLNRFFESGDSTYIYSNSECIIWDKEHYFKLYEFYKTLPAEKKFKFWGIDFDIDYYRESFYTHAIQKIMGSKTIDASLRHDIFDSTELSKKQCIQINDQLRKMILTDSGLIRQLVAANEFDDLSFIVSACMKHEFIPKRDNTMFRRLQQLEPRLIRNSNNEIKAYGQFGAIHTKNDKKAFINLVSEDDNNRLLYGHKLCTFGSLFYNCHSRKNPEQMIENMHADGEEIFKPFVDGLKSPTVLLIPNTEPYNGFDLTFCIYGY